MTSKRSATAQRPGVDDRLLGAMERLLERGVAFRALTVEQLVEEAGIARATFYLHFRDKNALVQRLTHRLTHEVIDSAGSWFRGDATVDRHTMRFALHGIVQTFKKHQAIFCAIADTATTDPEIARLHEAMMRELTQMSRRAIAKVKREGRAAPGVPAELPELLTWFVELYCARFLAGCDARRLNRLIEGFAFICGNAIFAAEA